MENIISATYLNDFIFCPASLYFHRMYMELDNSVFQETVQINGTNAHRTVDQGEYSTRKDIVTALDAYSEKFNIICRVDILDKSRKTIVERKNVIHKIYDGFVFQMYAQFFAVTEMGYEVEHLELYSMLDNKKYTIPLPNEDLMMLDKFEKTIDAMQKFDINNFKQTNIEKCVNCIYEAVCDKSLLEE